MIEVTPKARETAKERGWYTLQVRVRATRPSQCHFERSCVMSPKRNKQLMNLLMEWVKEDQKTKI